MVFAFLVRAFFYTDVVLRELLGWALNWFWFGPRFGFGLGLGSVLVLVWALNCFRFGP